MNKKSSFFERLTGSINMTSDDTDSDSEDDKETHDGSLGDWIEEESDEGELAVDVYQTTDNIILKAMIAGVRPEDLDVSITRDMVTIKGTRKETRDIAEDDYYYRELYWGSFSRTILLPQEIDPEESDAIEKYGLLEIQLPKIDRKKTKKLKIKTS